VTPPPPTRRRRGQRSGHPVGINAVSPTSTSSAGCGGRGASGAPVWLIETHETPTASVVDRTFLVRPGNDGALALGLMHLLVWDGLTDREFLARRVQGFERLRDEVLPRFPPDRVSQLTGLSVATLEEMARAYGRARAPFIRVGAGSRGMPTAR